MNNASSEKKMNHDCTNDMRMDTYVTEKKDDATNRRNKRKGHRKRGLVKDTESFLSDLRKLLCTFKEHPSDGEQTVDIPSSLTSVCSVKTISKNAENDADKTTIIAFSRNISAAYRQLVHIEAAKLQLHHGSHGVGDERYVVVSKESPQKHRDKCLGNESQHFLKDTDDKSIIRRNAFRSKCPFYLKNYLHPHSGEFMETRHLHPESTFLTPKQLEYTHIRSYVHEFSSMSSTEVFQAFSLPPNQSLRPPPDVSIVDNVDNLATMCDEINMNVSHSNIIAFDCECNSDTYLGKVCLLQISTASHNYLIDTLALWDHVYHYLNPIFQNPKILKIAFSISGCDVPGLYRDFGITIKSCLDLQVAYRLLTNEHVSLSKLLNVYKYPRSDIYSARKEAMKETDWRVRPFSVDMMVYASADTSCLFGLLVLICKNLIDQETGSAQSSLTKKHFAESSGDGNDLLISAIENGQANGEIVMMNAEMEHHKSSSGCCPSFLSAYDDITSNDAVYSMRDDDDDFEEYKEVRSIRELYHSMRRKIKEFWYDLCDDIFLNFGDYMDNINNSGTTGENEASNQTTEVNKSTNLKGMVSDGANDHSLIAKALITTAEMCSRLWRPADRHKIGYSTQAIFPALVMSEQNVHMVNDLIDGDTANENDEDEEDQPLKLEERRRNDRSMENNDSEDKQHHGASLDISNQNTRKQSEKNVQVRPVRGISVKSVDKFVQKYRSTWNSKNICMFYHLSIWRERTAAQYDVRVSYVLPAYLLLEISRIIPMSIEEIQKVTYPLPGILADELEYFDDGRHVQGAELLLASLLEGIQHYENAVKKLLS